MRDYILNHEMPAVRSKRVLQSLDGDAPWESTYCFLEGLAALSSLYSDELKRRTHIGGVQLRKLLFNAAAPSRMQWYLNSQRLHHSMAPAKIALLGSGTSPNETLQAEMNRWCRNQSEWYASTAEMQLQVYMFAKLVAHSSALYYPTLRQLRHSEVLSRACASLDIPSEQWQEYCFELKRDGVNLLSPALLPCFRKRQETKKLLRDHSLLKRPAAGKRPATATPLVALKRPARIKRTAFTLKRLRAL